MFFGRKWNTHSSSIVSLVYYVVVLRITNDVAATHIAEIGDTVAIWELKGQHATAKIGICNYGNV